MKLQHNLGGLEGIEASPVETRVFVEPWEERIFGIHAAMMALSPQLDLAPTSSTFNTVWTWADLRKGAEALNPFEYFRLRYYEKWLGGISSYFVANGTITEDELQNRISAIIAGLPTPHPTGGSADIDERIRTYLLVGDSPSRTPATTPRFAVGDAVHVGDPPTVEHTRLPGHLRSRHGIIETVYDGAYTYLCSTGPDGLGEPMPVYCVRFDPDTLWPGNTEENFVFYADLFETYLSQAS
jgi:nitrile hydratase subunit beta